MSKQSTRELTLVFFVAFFLPLCYCLGGRKAMRMKKDSGIGYVVLIVIILVLGFKLSQSYEDAKLDDAKVLDYVQHNISFYEVCSCYDEYDIKDYIYNKYIPYDIWDDITILEDTSWFELIDYGKKDMYGETLDQFLSKEEKPKAGWEMSWEEVSQWLEQQRG